MTCAHSLYDPITNKKCSRVRFYPNIKAGILANTPNYEADADHIYYDLPESGNFNYEPKKEDIAVICLNRSLPDMHWLKLSSNKDEEIHKGESLYLSGYPSSNYYDKFPADAWINLKTSEG